MSNNLQESVLPCVFAKLMPDGKVNDHSLVSKFHFNVPRLQPLFAASGHLVLCLCVTPVQTFCLLVGPHGKGHQNILVMHCICEDIKSCMHFMTLKILDSCLPNVELDERLT
ncbi:unnamed protein product [Sphagnum jensenii]|uniref:Uncharacterized protein n=1 Tax=Sphagnum jensenii TaxID=128206 RepID=A0ABP1AD53_9BRYO